MRYQIIQGDVGLVSKLLRDDSVDLIFADPPYWKVARQPWDHQWKTFEDYVNWVCTWLREAKRMLRPGGSIYICGFFRQLAHTVVVAEQLGFVVRQQIVIAKGRKAATGRRALENYKVLPVETESMLLLVKDPRPRVKEVLLEAQKCTGLSGKEINARLGKSTEGGGMWSFYTGNNSDAQIPTVEVWEKLRSPEIFGSFLWRDYAKLSQTWNEIPGLTDVWTDIDFNVKPRRHPTEKPRLLVDRVMRLSSRAGDLVFDPFAGSGVAMEVAATQELRYLGCDRDPQYARTL